MTSNMFRNFVISILLIQTLTVNAQEFGWGDSGYMSGGGFYTNIDGNGTDVTISGFVNEGTTWGTGCMITGIDNQQNDGIQHSYKLVFSQPIDLWFEISDINNGATWNDTLIFSGNPIFSDTAFVNLDGSSVLPVGGNNGQVKITYSNVDSITILHGAGISSNPVHIWICALHFDTTLNISTNSSLISEIKVYPNPAYEKITIRND